MRRIAWGVAMISLAAGSTSRGADLPEERWCVDQFPGGHRDYDELDAVVAPVKLDRMEVAKARLRSRSLQALTAAQADALAGPFPASGEGDFYLIRSGIHARPNASPADYHDLAKNFAHRLAFFRPGDRLLLIATHQMWEGESEIYRVPLVVRAKVKPASSAAICQTVF